MLQRCRLPGSLSPSGAVLPCVHLVVYAEVRSDGTRRPESSRDDVPTSCGSLPAATDVDRTSTFTMRNKTIKKVKLVLETVTFQ